MFWATYDVWPETIAEESTFRCARNLAFVLPGDSEGVEADPDKIVANAIKYQLATVNGGWLSYYRIFLLQMATVTRSLNKLLKKSVKFVFTTEHVEIVHLLMKWLSSPDIWAFPDFKAALSGDSPFPFDYRCVYWWLGCNNWTGSTGFVRPTFVFSE